MGIDNCQLCEKNLDEVPPRELTLTLKRKKYVCQDCYREGVEKEVRLAAKARMGAMLLSIVFSLLLFLRGNIVEGIAFGTIGILTLIQIRILKRHSNKDV